MFKTYPKLSQEAAGDGELTLHCPNCDGIYLHHKNADIYNRSEDDNIGTRIETSFRGATIGQDISGNPSLRRDAISVNFWCEGCDAIIVMDVIQHKGNTNLSMRFEIPEEKK